MKKTLIALSLAALSGAAFADVTLYGQIKAGVEVSKVKVKADGQEVEKSKTATEIADFGSRIGFKGHEAIGNGANLIWKLEQSASVAGNSKGWATREGYIGVETPAGTVRAGKIATQLDNMGTIDPWEYSNPALGLGVFTRTGEKVVSVRYDSPVFYGVSANVQYTPRDNVNPADKYTKNGEYFKGQTYEKAVDYKKDKDGKTIPVGNVPAIEPGHYDGKVGAQDAYYAGLNYQNAGFFAQYGFGLKKNNYTTNVAHDNGRTGEQFRDGYAHRVEAGYDANNLFVGLGYQYTTGWQTVNQYAATLSNDKVTPRATWATKDGKTVKGHQGVKTHEVAVTGAYRFGNVTPKISYAHGFDAKVADQKLALSKYDQVVVGADYDFSKRTTAFAQAGWLKAGKKDDQVTNTAGLVGLRHKF